MRQFLDLVHPTDAELRRLLDEARRFEQEPFSDALTQRVVGLLFLNPSLRTLVSMQTAVAHLGGTAVVVQPGTGSWPLELEDGVRMDGAAAEHAREAVPVLEQYCDALGVRVFAALEDLANDLADPALSAFTRLAEKPLINLESAVQHPLQALADWKTLDDLEVPTDGRFVLSWAQHPSPLPLAVPMAAASMAARRGMEVVVARPAGFELPQSLVATLESLAEDSGGSLHQTSDRDSALAGAHVVYAKSWSSTRHYGNPIADRELRRGLDDWCVDTFWFRDTAQDSHFLHCLPVRRGVVASDAVLDGAKSRVVLQAANRLLAQKAVLQELFAPVTAATTTDERGDP